MLKRGFVFALFGAIVVAFAWMGVANAGLLRLPFILGENASEPDAPPPWTDPATNIEVIAPVADVAYHSPIEIVGLSRTFEGTVNIRLLDSQNQVLAERFAIGGAVEGFDFFHTYVRFTVTEVQTGTVEIFEESAEDGSRLTEVIIPVTLLPGQRVVDLNSPDVGATVCNNIVVNGYSNTFEANVGIDVRARTGELITQTSALGGNLGIYADFSTAISVPVTQPVPLLISAYESSAEDGSLIDMARVPVALYPTGSAECP